MIAGMGVMMLAHRWYVRKHRKEGTTLDILQQRFARGEIDSAEYEASLKVLGTSTASVR